MLTLSCSRALTLLWAPDNADPEASHPLQNSGAYLRSLGIQGNGYGPVAEWGGCKALSRLPDVGDGLCMVLAVRERRGWQNQDYKAKWTGPGAFSSSALHNFPTPHGSHGRS